MFYLMTQNAEAFDTQISLKHSFIKNCLGAAGAEKFEKHHKNTSSSDFLRAFHCITLKKFVFNKKTAHIREKALQS